MSIRHVLDAREFGRDWVLETLFPLATRFSQTPIAELPQPLARKRLFYLFYEPSTRTRVSFETAMALLGGATFGMDSHEHRPEDERLEDRVRVLSEYAYDFLLLRSGQQGGAQRAAAVSRVPVINAGDGTGQHPTQALLDVYTLWREFGRIDGLRIALTGDLSYERTTNSLAYLLAQFRDIRVYLVAPRLLAMRQEVRSYLQEHGVEVHEATSIQDVASEVDVIYLTRAHTPRFEHARRFDTRPEAREPAFGLDVEVIERLSAEARVLHPLPRGPELPPEFDADPRIACFRQAHNGLWIRMALLTLLAG